MFRDHSGSHKFDAPFTSWLYEKSLDRSWTDDEVGTVDDIGWHGRIGRRILVNDSQGFVSCERYATDADASDEMDRIATDCAAWWIDDDPEEPFTDGPLQGKHATISGKPGIAWWIDADDGSGMVLAHMVGDDRRFSFYSDDVTVIDGDDICSCGQLGCGWGSA